LLKELSLHILDIAENSVQANAKNVMIKVEENTNKDILRFEVKDNGKGMNAVQLAQATNPFYTSRTTRKVGLGIPFLKEAAEACNGSIKINSKEGIGTTIQVEFQRNHIDRMPIGDLENTFLNLLIGYPDIHWIFQYKFDEKEFNFDDKPVKQELNGLSMSEPIVISFLRKAITKGLAEARESH
jgi:anti-sigma regulatory factor (Ser/Thr protein kinase)